VCSVIIHVPNVKDLGIVMDKIKKFVNKIFHSKGYENKNWF